MNNLKLRLARVAVTLAVAGLTLAAAWLVPPALHRALHYCPLRPDGVSTARAVPSYARKYEVSCTQCHTAYPMLNDFGRRFKMNGYVMGEGEEGVLKSKDGSFWTEKVFPWGVIARSRPFDNSRGSVANQGMQNGGSNGSTRDKFQPINDIDFFIGGGEASKHVSWLAEIDANAPGGFAPTIGDLQAGYHPSEYFNILLARKSFFAMEPYQTLSSMMTPTIAVRAIDGTNPDQNGLSGSQLAQQTQTAAVAGSASLGKVGELFYMAGATSGNADDSGRSRKNGNVRLAFDTLKGVVIGGFGSFGRAQPANIPASGSGNSNMPTPGAWVKFVKTGVDALVELGNFVGRGAFMYTYDSDPSGLGNGQVVGGGGVVSGRRFRDRAAYAELAYVYKRGGSETPFLMPLVRENWYTTYNNTRQFNYLTFQLAHYFQENVRAFVEYSIDTKTDLQGAPAIAAAGTVRVPRGNRIATQLEVGF